MVECNFTHDIHLLSYLSTINQGTTSCHPPKKQVIHLQANGAAQYCVMLNVCSNRFIYVYRWRILKWEKHMNVDPMNSTRIHDVDDMFEPRKMPSFLYKTPKEK